MKHVMFAGDNLALGPLAPAAGQTATVDHQIAEAVRFCPRICAVLPRSSLTRSDRCGKVFAFESRVREHSMAALERCIQVLAPLTISTGEGPCAHRSLRRK